MIPQSELSVEGLKAAIDRLRLDPAARKKMSVQIRAFHQVRAAEKLARLILERVTPHAAG